MKIPDEVKRLARAGQDKKIHAIHALRKATGLGLAEAKEIVETIAAGGEVQIATPAQETPSNQTREQRLRRQLEAIGRAGSVGFENMAKPMKAGINPRTGKRLEIIYLLLDPVVRGIKTGKFFHR